MVNAIVNAYDCWGGQTMLKPVLAILAMLSFSSGTTAIAGTVGQAWPRVPAQHYSVGVDFRAEHMQVVVPLLSESGKPLYQVVCVSGAPGATDGLVCGLSEARAPASDAIDRSLLAGAGPAAGSRGRFVAEQLVGTCAIDPMFGRVRVFRLRGFQLTLKIMSPDIRPGFKGGGDWRERYSAVAGGTGVYPIGQASLRVSVAANPQFQNALVDNAPVGEPDGC